MELGPPADVHIPPGLDRHPGIRQTLRRWMIGLGLAPLGLLVLITAQTGLWRRISLPLWIALLAACGFLGVRLAQSHRRRFWVGFARDIERWEGEGRRMENLKHRAHTDPQAAREYVAELERQLASLRGNSPALDRTLHSPEERTKVKSTLAALEKELAEARRLSGGAA
jgi:hypothetical protein